MTGYPSLPFALLQSVLTSVIMLTPPLVYAFGGSRLKSTFSDLLLMLCTFPALIVVTFLSFFPFEGAWFDVPLGPFAALHPLLVGGLVLTLGMAFTQRKGLAQRGATEAAVRLAAAFLMGAVWGAVWGFAGWCLENIGMTGNG